MVAYSPYIIISEDKFALFFTGLLLLLAKSYVIIDLW